MTRGVLGSSYPGSRFSYPGFRPSGWADGNSGFPWCCEKPGTLENPGALEKPGTLEKLGTLEKPGTLEKQGNRGYGLNQGQRSACD
eukprot:1385654-Amorphochlora_amoeboformis.AAC.1